MTAQDDANALLHLWQENRALPPAERLRRFDLDAETAYERTLDALRGALQEAA